MIGMSDINICAQRIVLSSTTDNIFISSILNRLKSLFTTTVYKYDASG